MAQEPGTHYVVEDLGADLGFGEGDSLGYEGGVGDGEAAKDTGWVG